MIGLLFAALLAAAPIDGDPPWLTGFRQRMRMMEARVRVWHETPPWLGSLPTQERVVVAELRWQAADGAWVGAVAALCPAHDGAPWWLMEMGAATAVPPPKVAVGPQKVVVRVAREVVVPGTGPKNGPRVVPQELDVEVALPLPPADEGMLELGLRVLAEPLYLLSVELVVE